MTSNEHERGVEAVAAKLRSPSTFPGETATKVARELIEAYTDAARFDAVHRMNSNEQRGLDADTPSPSPQMLGDGEAAIIECLAAGKPFVFDPATNFLHADDGTVEYGIRYVPDDRQPAPDDHKKGTSDEPSENSGRSLPTMDRSFPEKGEHPKASHWSAPADHVIGSEERGIGIGMAIAAGIIMRVWGQEVYAHEILTTAGFTTLDELKASGVDKFDIDALTPIFAATATEGSGE